MGKKSRRAQAASAAVQKPQAGAVINNRAVCRAVNDLWERTQGAVSDSLPTLWQDYDIISGITKVIKEKQGTSPFPMSDRKEKIAQFEKWLAENGAIYTDRVEITEYPDCGFGLKAKKDIKAEDKVLVIPDKLMMNSLTARDGLLGKLIAQDRILQMMHNVALSLHLLNEKYKGEESFWKPYIDVLPQTFTTPSYFTKAELLLLQGSPSLVKSIQQIRNVAKLFAHLHRLIRSQADPALPLYKVGFYFQDFVWAVTSVMSRQNEIPLGISHGSTLALIPLWDFANHTEGHMTTFFDVENRLCECFASQNTKAGEEFKIFYGPRNNSDLFVHQGFVYVENQSDSVPIKLGLSPAESSKTRALKERLLAEAELAMPGSFKIMAMGDPFTSELRFVVRVFTASHEKLQQFFNESGAVVGVSRLVVPWHRSDDKALDFLEKRCQLLLQAYKTTIEEDAALLNGARPLSPCSAMAVRMRLSEKKILYNASLFARTLRDRLLSQPPMIHSQNGGNQPTIGVGAAAARALSLPVITEVDNGDTNEQSSGTGASKGEVKLTGNADSNEQAASETLASEGEPVKINGGIVPQEGREADREEGSVEQRNERKELVMVEESEEVSGDVVEAKGDDEGGGGGGGGGGTETSKEAMADLEPNNCVIVTK